MTYRDFFRNRSFTFGFVIVLAFFLLAAVAPLLFPDNPMRMIGRPLQWPKGEFSNLLLGTDPAGRSMISFIAYGAQNTLYTAFSAMGISLVIGVLVGMLAGYFSGAINAVLMQISDAFQITPAFIFLLVIVAAFGASSGSIGPILGFLLWPGVARLVRSETLRVRSENYVSASRLVGQPNWRILLTDVLPNVASPAISYSVLLASLAILFEASLAFLGLGDPNVANWGALVGSGRSVIRTQWYVSAVPGLAIFMFVGALGLLGQGLNDLLNPRLRGGRNV